MKALVLEAYKQFVYKEVPDPEIGPEDVLVKVHAAGICGSDIHGMDGSTGRRIPPVIMGHEASGVIAGLGAQTTGWKFGDRVTFDSTIYCGKCFYCRRGQINLCDNRRVLGVSCEEYRQNGAFAEYLAVPQHILYRIPGGVTFQQAAMVEPLSIAYHAAAVSQIVLNDTAVVVGAGLIGLLMIQVLRLAGCGRIIAVEPNPKRRELACKLGADDSLDPDTTDVVAQVQAQTGGRGADLAFEAVGIKPTINLATRSLRKGGSLTLIGNITPAAELLLQAVVTRQLRLQGSCASNGEYLACMDAIQQNRIDVDSLISAREPLADGAAWFERLYQGASDMFKVVLEP